MAAVALTSLRNASDGASAPKVTVVSETTARALRPGEDPLGKAVLVRDEEAFTVVGVVQDASRRALREEPYMAFYLPVAQRPERDLKGLYIRWSGRKAELSELTTAVASALRSAGPGVRYATVRPLREVLDPQARSWTLGATLFTVFGVLALVVAAVGLYNACGPDDRAAIGVGLFSFTVAQRTREIAVRAALGARRAELMTMVLGDALRLTSVGLTFGVLAAVASTRVLEGQLYGVSALDHATFGGVIVLLALAAVSARLLPARRAAAVDPITALRQE